MGELIVIAGVVVLIAGVLYAYNRAVMQSQGNMLSTSYRAGWDENSCDEESPLEEHWKKYRNIHMPGDTFDPSYDILSGNINHNDGDS
jgi:hypothetical protein